LVQTGLFCEAEASKTSFVKPTTEEEQAMVAGLLYSCIAASFLLAPPLRIASQAGCRTTAVHAAAPAATSSGTLHPGDCVEVWHKGALCVGNYRGRSKSALLIDLSAGEQIKIDGGQLVDVWDDDGAVYPRDPDEWRQLEQGASTLLTELPPHMLDLRPLWQRLLGERGSSKQRVDSARVAEHLFRSPHAEKEIRRSARGGEGGGKDGGKFGSGKRDGGGGKGGGGSGGGGGGGPGKRLAQRLAAAQLLGEEGTLFKRQPMDVTPAPISDGVDDDVLSWSRGGFRPLPRSTASSRAETVLIDAMRERLASVDAQKKAGAPAAAGDASADGDDDGGDGARRLQIWPSATLPLLAEVEMVALGLMPPNKQLERLLAAFDQPTNASGARDLLLAVGQWNEGETDSEVPLGYSSGVWLDPFPSEALSEGEAVARRMRERRLVLEKLALPSSIDVDGGGGGGNALLPWWLTEGRSRAAQGCDVGDGDGDASVLMGRVDLRARCPRAFAIDNDNTDFRDDAISYDATTGTLAVHITDLSSSVPAGSLLDDVARLRLQTIYSGAMPLHMLPPPLLREQCLSSKYPNECVSALLQLDAYGRVRSSRLVRSVIPPVRTLSFAEVEALLAETPDIDSSVHRDLRGLAAITRRRHEARIRRRAGEEGARNPEAARAPRASPERASSSSPSSSSSSSSSSLPAVMRWRFDATSGSWRPTLMDRHGAAHMLVDEALGMFSYAVRGAGKRHNLLRLPQTENHRIATAPLRRYADLLAQRQLCAAMCGLPGMPASEVAAIERWIKQKQSDMASSRTSQPQMLRALEAHCARQATTTGLGFAVLEGTVSQPMPAAAKPPAARPQGRKPSAAKSSKPAQLEVRLMAGGVIARATMRNLAQARDAALLQRGERVKVRLRSVDARRGLVEVELL
jgi:uncharacterized membrane protein YgcG